MQYLAIIKRVIPFVGTFALGLLIASFFVVLPFPKVEVESNITASEIERKLIKIRRSEHRMRQLECDHKKRGRNVIVIERKLRIPPPPPKPAAPSVSDQKIREAVEKAKVAVRKAAEKAERAVREEAN